MTLSQKLFVQINLREIKSVFFTAHIPNPNKINILSHM